MTKIGSTWLRYVDFWREHEAPDALALGRITFGVALAVNVLYQMAYPGVLELYALPEEGGIFAFDDPGRYSLLALAPPTASVVWALVVANLVAAIGLTVGLLTRFMALALMVTQLTLVWRLGLSGFGGDSIVTVFTFLMVLAPSGASWSLDAAWRGRATSVPKWPRRLIIAQLTLLYVKTGVVKAGSTWSFSGGYSALYYALSDPGFGRWPARWAAWLYPVTQVGSFVARWWETLFFAVPLNMGLRRRPGAGGRLRRGFTRFDLRGPYLAVGVVLHVGLALTMELGMFSWLTLSLYPFFLEPQEARAVLQRVFRARGSREPSQTGPPVSQGAALSAARTFRPHGGPDGTHTVRPRPGHRHRLHDRG